MHVLGIPQIYAYLVGWWQYDLMWNIVRDTGLFYIPFAIIFSKCVIEPFMSQETRSAATTAVKRIAVSMISLIIMIPLFYVPAWKLNVNSIKFEKGGNSYVAGKTDTTFDDKIDLSTFGGGVYMPIMWQAALSVFNGITALGYNSFQNGKFDARQATKDLMYTAIQDPKLKKEIQDFIDECYIPAYADYMNNKYPQSQAASIQNLYEKSGKESDISWIGSKVLTQYFYPNYQAKQPVPGFPFETQRDAVQGQVDNHSKWGQPYCSEWWLTSSNNLHTRLWDSLVEQTGSQIFWDLRSQYHYLWGDDWATLQDKVIQVYLQKNTQTNSGWAVDQGYYSENDNRSGSSSSIGTSMSKVGLVVDYNTTYSAYITTLINMLPLIQAMLLAILFALIPIGMVLSMFSWRYVITALTMTFFLIFLTYIWRFVSYFDTFLIVSLYESPKTGAEGIRATLINYFSDSLSPAMILVDITASLMYIGFPMFMLGLIGWAGVNVGDSGFRVAGQSADGQAKSSGSAGGKVIKGAISKGVK